MTTTPPHPPPQLHEHRSSNVWQVLNVLVAAAVAFGTMYIFASSNIRESGEFRGQTRALVLQNAKNIELLQRDAAHDRDEMRAELTEINDKLYDLHKYFQGGTRPLSRSTQETR